MTHATNHWDIELSGEMQDKEVWCELLKPSFDPLSRK